MFVLELPRHGAVRCAAGEDLQQLGRVSRVLRLHRDRPWPGGRCSGGKSCDAPGRVHPARGVLRSVGSICSCDAGLRLFRGTALLGDAAALPLRDAGRYGWEEICFLGLPVSLLRVLHPHGVHLHRSGGHGGCYEVVPHQCFRHSRVSVPWAGAHLASLELTVGLSGIMGSKAVTDDLRL